MRILKIWDAEYPWDVRAEKVMRSLKNAGHEVHLVARNRRNESTLEELDEALVHRMGSWARLGRTVDHVVQFPAFFNPRWIRLIDRVARERKVDLILVRDLPLAPTAVWVGRRRGVPVILDMAENYAAMMRDLWTSGSTGPFDWLVRNPRIVERVEKSVVGKLDHIVVVVDESADRMEQLGVDPSRLSVVVNTPWPSRIPDEVIPDRSGSSPRLVYLGLLERPRGVGTVLEAIRLCVDRGHDVSADVIGGGRAESEFRARSLELGLGDRVRFHGVLPYEQALEVVRKADIGLVPHVAVESWNTTIPNKLFDYMSHGLPVITSDARPAARVVRETECGEVFRSEDVNDLAGAIERLVDPVVRRRKGLKGREAVVARYNWAEDEKRLLETVERVGRRGRD